MNEVMRICQVSLSLIDKDPRVLRTISALQQAGHDVIPVGYGYGMTASPMVFSSKLIIALRQLPAACGLPGWASFAYWRERANKRLYNLLISHKPDIIHTHDWDTLPAAARAAKLLGARLIYDSHEFAAGQRLHRLFWRLVYPAYIGQLEKQNIHQADHIITVSDGLAELLRKHYNLARAPTVLRSTPSYSEAAFRKTDPQHILLHYHGIFTHGRGLRKLINSVADWPQQYHLRLTGWGQPPQFERELKQLADQQGIAQRVSFFPGVSHNELIDHANQADIGVCFWDGEMRQLDLALPNKVFEYSMAGLMLACGPTAELKNFVSAYDLGICLKDNQPETLSEALAALTPDVIDTCKQNALEAALQLCWETEQKKLLAIYNEIVSERLNADK